MGHIVILSSSIHVWLCSQHPQVCSQKAQLQNEVMSLQEHIGELDGIRKASADKIRATLDDSEKRKKGPSAKALWHYYSMVSEPWSKGTKLSQRKLQFILETSMPSKKKAVLPLIRATTPHPYLTFNDFTLIMAEFKPKRQDWNRMVQTLTGLQATSTEGTIDENSN